MVYVWLYMFGSDYMVRGREGIDMYRWLCILTLAGAVVLLKDVLSVKFIYVYLIILAICGL